MITKFLIGPFGKIALYLIIGLVSLGSVFGIYKIWENGVQERALLEFNQSQLEQVIKDQARYNAQLVKLNENQSLIIKQVTESIAQSESTMEEINAYIDASEDRPSSDVLKGVIEKLRGKK